MKWTFKLGSYAGIKVYVHATFFLLLLWFAYSAWTRTASIAVVVDNMVFICALFGCVVLHEFGHALTARRFGVATRHITLFPIGGVATMEKLPADPRQEMLVALAGPMVNLVIAAAIGLWLYLQGMIVDGTNISLFGGDFLARLMVVNIVLAVFNLVPAFPMDGGRVLRAAMAMRMERARATRLAASVGQSLALLFGLLGILYNPFLVLIAVFIWLGAAAEAGAEEMRSLLGHTTVGQAMLTDYHTVSEDDALGHAVELTVASSQKDFPVLDRAGNYRWILTQTDMLRGLQRQGSDSAIGRLELSSLQSVDADAQLEAVLEKFQQTRPALMTVTRADQVLGIINLDNILEIASIARASQTTFRP